MSDRQRRPHRTLELGVILLLNEILGNGVAGIPPVTLFTIAGQALLYTDIVDVPWSRTDACISAYKVWQQRKLSPLILSVVEHADDMHLYYNMVSFLVKGRSLERKYGSLNFAILLPILSLATSCMYVALAIFVSRVFDFPEMMQVCSIGFSGVIFALKVITASDDDGYATINGMRIKSKYTAWAELFLIAILVPQSSFIGHLAGVLVGTIYTYTFVGRIINYAIETFSGSPMSDRERRDVPPRRESSSTDEPGSQQYYYRNPGSYTFNHRAGQYQRSPQYGWRY